MYQTDHNWPVPGSEMVGKEINPELTWKKIARELGRERGAADYDKLNTCTKL